MSTCLAALKHFSEARALMNYPLRVHPLLLAFPSSCSYRFPRHASTNASYEKMADLSVDSKKLTTLVTIIKVQFVATPNDD